MKSNHLPCKNGSQREMEWWWELFWLQIEKNCGSLRSNVFCISKKSPVVIERSCHSGCTMGRLAFTSEKKSKIYTKV